MDYRLKAQMPLIVDLLQTRNFSLHKMLIDGLEWWIIVDYCDVLSDVWTLILMAPILCRGSIDEQVM